MVIALSYSRKERSSAPSVSPSGKIVVAADAGEHESSPITKMTIAKMIPQAQLVQLSELETFLRMTNDSP